MGALSLETSLSPKIGGDCGDGKNELMKKKNTHLKILKSPTGSEKSTDPYTVACRSSFPTGIKTPLL
jgi:hypothetical protein